MKENVLSMVIITVSQSIKALKNLGVVFQQPTIDLELTVKENLLFHARLHGLKLLICIKL